MQTGPTECCLHAAQKLTDLTEPSQRMPQMQLCVWSGNLGVFILTAHFGWSPPLSGKIHPEFSLVSFPLFWGAGRVDGVNVWSWKGSNSHWVTLTWNKGLLGAAPQFLYTHCLKLDVFKGDFAFNLLLGTFNRSVTLAIQAFLNLSEEMNGEAGVPISRIQRRVVD